MGNVVFAPINQCGGVISRGVVHLVNTVISPSCARPAIGMFISLIKERRSYSTRFFPYFPFISAVFFTFFFPELALMNVHDVSPRKHSSKYSSKCQNHNKIHLDEFKNLFLIRFNTFFCCSDSK